MTVAPTTAEADHDALTSALRTNLRFSTTSGIAAVTGAGWLDDVLGVPWPLLVGLGLGLLAFAAALRVLVVDPDRDRRLVRAVVAADVTWVVAAGTVVGLDVLTPAGDVVLVTVTLVVAAIAAAQVRGLRRV